MIAKDISFPPSSNPSAQFEALIVNAIAVLIGLGWSNLALACAAFAGGRYGIDSDVCRVIRACFLITLGFFAGLARSRMPRLTLAARAVCLIGIWLVARAPKIVKWDYHSFTELLFAFSVAGAASLFVSLIVRIFIRPGGYAEDVVEVFEILKKLMQYSTLQTPIDEPQTEILHTKSLDKVLALHTSYAYSTYELRVGRVPIKSIKPLLITVNRIREMLAWGNVRTTRDTGTFSEEFPILSQLEGPCISCALAIVDGISTLQAALGKCFAIKLSNNAHKTVDLGDLLTGRMVIINSQGELKKALDSVLHRSNKMYTLGSVNNRQKELFRKSLHSASFLQISSELIRALTLAHSILTIHQAASRPYLFFPRPSRFWFGVLPRSVITEEFFPFASGPTTEVETELFDEARTTSHSTSTTAAPSRRRSATRFMHTPTALRARIRLSNWLWRVRHSNNLQFAFKHALGISVLMIPAILPESSRGRQYYDSSYGVWAIISFVYVIEPNTALTWRAALWRVFGTGLGALYAFIAWHIAGTNPYGIVALVTAAEIFITWLIRSSAPGVGVVASITIPPVLFIPYLGIGQASILHLTALRALQITIGIIAAVLIDHMVFPKRVRSIFLSNLAEVMKESGELYSGLSETYSDRPAGPRSAPEPAHTQSCSIKQELRIRKHITQNKMYLSQMKYEISLIPKPITSYREVTDYAQRLVDLIVGLRCIRESVSRMAIAPVLAHRKQVDSCITLALYTCEHAFRSRQASPQVLPLSNMAFNRLNIALMGLLESEARKTDIGYVLAENKVTEEIIQVVEGLVRVTHDLFGTRAWFNGIDMVA